VGLDGLLQNIILLLRFESARVGRTAGNRAVQSIKAMAFNLGHNVEEAKAKTTCTKCPEKAAKRCCYEGACDVLVLIAIYVIDLILPKALQSFAYSPPSNKSSLPASVASPS
jgi:hypothetical protein